jgi:addiction module HigA family antidote
MLFWLTTRNIIKEKAMTRMHNPAHPGEVLREFLPPDKSIGEVALRLGISRPHLSRLLNGHSSMTAEMSIKIGLLTGTSPESWLYNQVQWDLWREIQKPLPKIEPFQMSMAA